MLLVLESCPRAMSLMSDRSDLQRLLTSGESVVRLGGRYDLDGPLLLPDWPFELCGSGIESTELVFHDGCDGFIGRFSTFYTNCPLTLKNMTLSQRGIGGTAISLNYPDASSVNEPTAYLEKLSLRPSPTLGTAATWQHGIHLTNAWNARIRDCTIHARNQDIDPTGVFPMKTALALHRSTQDLQVSGLLVYGGIDTGILIESSALGYGEGTLIQQAAMVGVRVGIKADSSKLGQTPWLHLNSTHIYFHETAVLLIGRTDAAIIGNSFVGSAKSKHTVGVYIAGGSDNARIIGNSFSTMNPEPAYGVVIDASRAATIIGNAFDTYMGIWATGSSSECAGSGNSYRHANYPMINQGRENQVA